MDDIEVTCNNRVNGMEKGALCKRRTKKASGVVVKDLFFSNYYSNINIDQKIFPVVGNCYQIDK